NDCLDKAGMIVLVTARQARRDFVKGQSRQDGDAVESLLTVHCNIVAHALEFEPGEGVVDAFGFLKADQVGPAFRQPVEGTVHSLFDGIDVPGGNSHSRFPIGTRSNWARDLCRVMERQQLRRVYAPFTQTWRAQPAAP